MDKIFDKYRMWRNVTRDSRPYPFNNIQWVDRPGYKYGDPQATSKFSVEELQRMGARGCYRADSGEFVRNEFP
jgi:hypothetical protein